MSSCYTSLSPPSPSPTDNPGYEPGDRVLVEPPPSHTPSGPAAELSRSPLQRILGLSLVLGASLLFSASTTGAKYLHSISSGQYVIVRGITALLLLLPCSCYTGSSLVSFHKGPLVGLRTVTHGLGYTLKVWCVKNMDIGDAVSIYFTAAIFAGFFSRVFLKEKYTAVNAVSAVLGFGGVFLIAQPSFIFKQATVTYNPLYTLIALTAACSTGAGYTVQRAIGPGLGSQITPFYTNCWVVLGGVLVNKIAGQEYTLPSCYDERAILLGCGTASCIGLVLLNIGLSIEKSASASIMRNMDIVIAFLVQVFVFREPAGWLSVVGAGLIVTGAVAVTLENALCPAFCWRI